ncbi:PhnD/SsuA/transferrin family substrate-binding protein [uncultured Brevibacillus sp.]|uniref:PhnD/SsuA/transferrin family substrate-binding protein n=1 Tax=uncultured Brevibacillus sp. TaxID=169970 RepID=UPI002594094F|nr:PhnD/SsuA/transferrin family substrate-binding protein [uncultured Brevibacillus sp.]
MKKAWLLILAVVLALGAAGCSTTSSGQEKDTITIAWLPNESGDDSKEARNEVGAIVERATGKKVEHKTTTDYIIAVESIANGNADLAFMGAEGYIQAHDKNQKVLPLVVPSGKSGTLDDAVYYSWLNVKKGNEDQYKSGDGFSIDNIVGKKFSFVSNNSTSGFKVPTAGIVSHFSKQEQYKAMSSEDLLEGGSGKFFSEVLYGGSHQGSAVNLLTGKADVAAFCDTCVNNYIELADGTKNKPGAVYRVKQDAAEPFNTLHGQEFVSISVTPVLNSPFVINTETVNEEVQKKILAAFTSDDTANNPKIFVPKDSKFSGFYEKSSGKEHFVQVEDAWFNPVRELSK